MDYDQYQRKLSQLEKNLKRCMAESLTNNGAFSLSQYVETFCVFIIDFDIINFFGEGVIDDSWLSMGLGINERKTRIRFEWNFRVDDDIDQDRNMIYLDLIFADRYANIQAMYPPVNGGHIHHYVYCEDVYKVQYFGSNIFFDVNLESSLQKLISDIHYQEMKDEEPVAVAIYSYSDN